VSRARGGDRGPARAGVDRWAAGRVLLRAADPRMALLVDADPGLNPDVLFETACRVACGERSCCR
jgi:hypothetical protein